MSNDKNQDKDLMNVLAHELRTPLNSLSGFINVTTMSGDLNERQKYMLDKALEALDRMNTLIDDVLDMSRLDSDSPLVLAPCDLRQIVGEAVLLAEGVAEHRGVKIHIEAPADIPPIHAEERRLRQLVNNLVSNAVKYNREKGEVRVQLAYTSDELTLKVTDTGYGIPEDDLPHIFERFFRSRVGVREGIRGNGLGLAIVKTIVERHQGTITVESEVDVGTTFFVALPYNLA